MKISRRILVSLALLIVCFQGSTGIETSLCTPLTDISYKDSMSWGVAVYQLLPKHGIYPYPAGYYGKSYEWPRWPEQYQNSFACATTLGLVSSTQQFESLITQAQYTALEQRLESFHYVDTICATNEFIPQNTPIISDTYTARNALLTGIPQVPKAILETFVADGWIFDISQRSSPGGYNSSTASGVCDYENKKIYLFNAHTVLHEIGHYIEWRSDARHISDTLYELEHDSLTSFRDYTKANAREYMADMFAYSIENPSIMQEAPITFQFIQDVYFSENKPWDAESIARYGWSFSHSYTDIASSPYFDGIQKAIESGYMTGMGNGNWSPSGAITRAQAVQIIYNYYYGVAPLDGVDFIDVSSKDWFYPALCWAKSSHYIQGTSPTTFGPNNKITKEQMAAIFYRIEGFPKVYVTEVTSASAWAQEAWTWAVDIGMFDANDIPQSLLLRGEMAMSFLRVKL